MQAAGVPLTASTDDEGDPMSISDAIAMSMISGGADDSEEEQDGQHESVRSKVCIWVE